MDYPFLLPCVVAVLWAIVGLVATLLCVSDDRPAVSWCDLLCGRADRHDPDSWCAAEGGQLSDGDEAESLLGADGEAGSGSDGKRAPPSPRTPRTPRVKMSYCAMLTDRELGPAIQVYMWANTVWVIYMELLPLFGKAT